MKNRLLTILLVLNFSNLICQNNKIIFDTIFSNNLGYKRNLKIVVPENIQAQSNGKYNTVYILDGQYNEFYESIISSFSFFNNKNTYKIPPFIFVGIETDTNRSREFTPASSSYLTSLGWGGFQNIGNSEKYIKFLKEELVPYVERKYNVTDYRIGIGYSLGGTLMFSTITNKTDLFNAVFLISPNLIYDNFCLIDSFKKNINRVDLKNFFLYVSVGNKTLDSSFRIGVKYLEKELKKKKLKYSLSYFSYFDGYDHSETPLISIADVLFKYSLIFKRIETDSLDYVLNNPKQNYCNYLKNYYKKIASFMEYEYFPEESSLNYYAYFAFYKNKVNDALEVINWAIEIYPDGFNLYDSKAEFVLYSGNKTEAIKFYNLALLKLEKSKPKLSDLEYIRFKKIFTEHLNNL